MECPLPSRIQTGFRYKPRAEPEVPFLGRRRTVGQGGPPAKRVVAGVDLQRPEGENERERGGCRSGREGGWGGGVVGEGRCG